jgi:peptide/nickel transport system substrate-binding protein
LRGEWIKAHDLEDRQAIAAKIQARAFEVVPYIPTGQFTPKTAYRKTLEGVIPAPVILMWNVVKT